MSDGDRRTKLRSVWGAISGRYPDLINRHGTSPWDSEGRLTRAAYEDLQAHLPGRTRRPSVSEGQQYTPFPTGPSGSILPRGVPDQPTAPPPRQSDYPPSQTTTLSPTADTPSFTRSGRPVYDFTSGGYWTDVAARGGVDLAAYFKLYQDEAMGVGEFEGKGSGLIDLPWMPGRETALKRHPTLAGSPEQRAAALQEINEAHDSPFMRWLNRTATTQTPLVGGAFSGWQGLINPAAGAFAMMQERGPEALGLPEKGMPGVLKQGIWKWLDPEDKALVNQYYQEELKRQLTLDHGPYFTGGIEKLSRTAQLNAATRAWVRAQEELPIWKVLMAEISPELIGAIPAILRAGPKAFTKFASRRPGRPPDIDMETSGSFWSDRASGVDDVTMTIHGEPPTPIMRRDPVTGEWVKSRRDPETGLWEVTERGTPDVVEGQWREVAKTAEDIYERRWQPRLPEVTRPRRDPATGKILPPDPMVPPVKRARQFGFEPVRTTEAPIQPITLPGRLAAQYQLRQDPDTGEWIRELPYSESRAITIRKRSQQIIDSSPFESIDPEIKAVGPYGGPIAKYKQNFGVQSIRSLEIEKQRLQAAMGRSEFKEPSGEMGRHFLSKEIEKISDQQEVLERAGLSELERIDDILASKGVTLDQTIKKLQDDGRWVEARAARGEELARSKEEADYEGMSRMPDEPQDKWITRPPWANRIPHKDIKTTKGYTTRTGKYISGSEKPIYKADRALTDDELIEIADQYGIERDRLKHDSWWEGILTSKGPHKGSKKLYGDVAEPAKKGLLFDYTGQHKDWFKVNNEYHYVEPTLMERIESAIGTSRSEGPAPRLSDADFEELVIDIKRIEDKIEAEKLAEERLVGRQVRTETAIERLEEVKARGEAELLESEVYDVDKYWYHGNDTFLTDPQPGTAPPPISDARDLPRGERVVYGPTREGSTEQKAIQKQNYENAVRNAEQVRVQLDQAIDEFEAANPGKTYWYHGGPKIADAGEETAPSIGSRLYTAEKTGKLPMPLSQINEIVPTPQTTGILKDLVNDLFEEQTGVRIDDSIQTINYEDLKKNLGTSTERTQFVRQKDGPPVKVLVTRADFENRISEQTTGQRVINQGYLTKDRSESHIYREKAEQGAIYLVDNEVVESYAKDDKFFWHGHGDQYHQVVKSHPIPIAKTFDPEDLGIKADPYDPGVEVFNRKQQLEQDEYADIRRRSEGEQPLTTGTPGFVIEDFGDPVAQRISDLPEDVQQAADRAADLEWRRQAYGRSGTTRPDDVDDIPPDAGTGTPTGDGGVGTRGPGHVPPNPDDPMGGPTSIDGNQFVGGFDDIRTVMNGIDTWGNEWAKSNPVMRAVLRSIAGVIAPSKVAWTDIQKATYAYHKIRTSGEYETNNIIKVALGSLESKYGFDFGPIKRGFRGGTEADRTLSDYERILGSVDPQVFEIGVDSRMLLQDGQRVAWYDVFENLDLYRNRLNPTEIKYIERFHIVIDEIMDLARSRGLDVMSLEEIKNASKNSKGEGFTHWVPRVARGKKTAGGDIPFGTTNHTLERLFDLAEEGVQQGVIYERDPQEVLRLIISSVYRKIADDDLASITEDLAIDVFAKDNPGLRESLKAAKVEFNKALNERNRLVVPRGTPGEGSSLAERQYRRELKSQRDQADVVFEEKKAAYNAARNAYKEANEKLRSTSTVKTEEGLISVGKWKNQFFAVEDAKTLNQHFGIRAESPEQIVRYWNSLMRGTEQTMSWLRTAIAGAIPVDVSAQLVQGLLLLPSYPKQWFGGAWRSVWSVVDPGYHKRWLAKERMADPEGFSEMSRKLNISDPEFTQAYTEPGAIPSVGGWVESALNKPLQWEWSAQLARSIGLSEQTAANIRRGLITAPVRQMIGRTSAAYNMFLSFAKVELWKALRSQYDDTDMLAAYINDMTGGFDSRRVGVGNTQRSLESAFVAFSPKLFRSLSSLMWQALKGLLKKTPGVRSTATQRESDSLKSVFRLIAAATAVTMAGSMAAGMTAKEAFKNIDPRTQGKRFWGVKVGGDYIGFGGMIRSTIQALGQAVRDPGSITRLGEGDNLFLSHWGSRGAIGTKFASMIGETITGADLASYVHIERGDIRGLISAIGSSSLPIMIQGKLDGERLLTSALSAPGARTAVLSPGEKQSEAAEQLIREGGVSFGEGQRIPPDILDQSYKQIINSQGYGAGSAWAGMGNIDDSPDRYGQLPPSMVSTIRRQPEVSEWEDKKLERTIQTDRNKAALDQAVNSATEDRNRQMEKLKDLSVKDSKDHPYKMYRLGVGKINRAFHQARRLAYEEFSNKFDPPDNPIRMANDEIANTLFPPPTVTDEHRSYISDRLGSYVPLNFGDELNLDRDWDEYERRFDYLASRYSKKYVDDYLEKSWGDKPLIEQQRNQAFKLIRDNGWWDTREQAARNLGDSYSRLYQDYQTWNADQRANIRGGQKAAINEINRLSSNMRQGMRRGNSDLNKAIIEWGFSTVEAYEFKEKRSKVGALY